MENLSLNEATHGGAPNNAHPPPPAGGPAQLPPQMFTTAAQLLDLTDKKLVLVLRDGRKIVGVLRSWDQFANLVLTESIERIFAKDAYADLPRGIFLVRGENVLLLGEVDLDKDDYVPEPFRKVSEKEALELLKDDKYKEKKHEKKRDTALQRLGFEAEHAGEALY